MNLPERLNQMKREYRREADRLDKRIDEAELRADKGLASVSLQMQAIQDQMGGVVESIQQLRADQREVSRTMSGRSRLLEERFGKMIEAVGSELDTQLGDLTRRVEALENKSEPAA